MAAAWTLWIFGGVALLLTALVCELRYRQEM